MHTCTISRCMHLTSDELSFCASIVRLTGLLSPTAERFASCPALMLEHVNGTKGRRRSLTEENKILKKFVFPETPKSGRGGRCTQFVHGRSRMAIDPRTPAMPGRSALGFHQPGSHCLPTRRPLLAPSANRNEVFGESHEE